MNVNTIVDAVNLGRLNIRHFYPNDDVFFKKILNQMNPKNIIGQGGVGKVYLIENGQYVVKESTPCYTNYDKLKIYCRDIEKVIETNKFNLIQCGDKKRYILPNLLSEAVIGLFFNFYSNDFVNFTDIVASFILINNGLPSVYFIMPAYQNFLTKNILTPALNSYSYLYFLFQSFSALLNAQQKFRFTHYDLHINNILWEKWPENKNYISYPLPNKNKRIMISKADCPFIVKITDYGLSRMETDTTIISPTIDSSYPEATFGEFNPNYDLISLIGTTFIDEYTSRPFSSLFNSLGLFKTMIRFILWFFKDKDIILPETPTIFDCRQARYNIGIKYFKATNKEGVVRFRPKVFEQNLITFFNTRSCVEVVNYLGEILIKTKAVYPEIDSYNVIKVPDYSYYKIFDPIIPFTRELADPIAPLPNRLNYTSKEIELEPGYIFAKTFRVHYNKPPNNYNFTISEKQEKHCPIQEHYMTTVYVKKNTPGYEFGLKCCKMDPANYLRNSENIGFVVNGGFFQIKSDFSPIGDYKDDHIKTNNPIPENYLDTYGHIYLNGNNMKISRKLFNNKYILTSGPMLIENGEIILNPYENRFACINEKDVEPPMQILNISDKEIEVSGYFNYREGDGMCYKKFVNEPNVFSKCSTIEPGELSHTDNPNPRTAAAILSNGDMVFITVEGRENRGVGIDLYTLAETIKKAFSDVVIAINLDGGRSSNIAWRSSISPRKVYITNPDHMYQYPVGNILTFFKDLKK